MRGKRLSVGLRATLAILTVIVLVTSAYTATEQVLYSFGAYAGDGDAPFASLIFDASGNLYGTTFEGGAYGFGAVFELMKPVTNGGNWTEQVLYSFGAYANDGTYPHTSLIFDASGNLYGTTAYGGTNGDGTVFELIKPDTNGGSWTEGILYSFGVTEGYLPNAAMIFDASGNLYGATFYGGAYGAGTVFELIKPATKGGSWTEEILHSFYLPNGVSPRSNLIFDASGNLYGTTFKGGTFHYGTVFELIKPATSGGRWTEQVLYSFNANGADGYHPFAGLIFGAAGNLYGTTRNGGAYGAGTVFKLIKPVTKGGSWTEKILHSFDGTDGGSPRAGLIFDAASNLYGTTIYGGASRAGTVFELIKPTTRGGSWTEQVLYSFGAYAGDGDYPFAGVIFDADDNLYGTTKYGGAYGYGTVFEITPQP